MIYIARARSIARWETAPNVRRAKSNRANVVIIGLFLCGALGLVMVASGQTELSDAAIFGAFACLVVGLSAVLLGKGSGMLGILFGAGILLRLLLLTAWEISPPPAPPSAAAVVSGVIFEDETHYVTRSQELAGSWPGILNLNWSNVYERPAIVFAMVRLLAGNESVWVRLLLTLATSFTGLLVYDAVRRVAPRAKPLSAAFFLFLSPALLIWSILQLKEGLLTLGIAAVLNAAVRYFTQRRWNAPVVLLLLFGSATILAFRWPLLPLMLFPWLVGSRLVRRAARLNAFRVAFIAIALPIAVLLFMPDWALAISTNMLELSRFTQAGWSAAQAGDTVGFLPFLTTIGAWPNPFRHLAYTCVLAISPVITSVWSIMPFSSQPSWLSFTIAAFAVNWWVCLPFILIQARETLRQRHPWWFSWIGVFAVWFVIAAISRFGIGYDSFRYRDAMLPVQLFLAAQGMAWASLRRRRYRAPLQAYLGIVILLVILRGTGLLRLGA